LKSKHIALGELSDREGRSQGIRLPASEVAPRRVVDPGDSIQPTFTNPPFFMFCGSFLPRFLATWLRAAVALADDTG